MGDDKSDLAQQTRETCRAYLPDAENKATLWKELTNTDSADSSYIRSAKLSGFYASSQKDLVAPYFDLFFEVLPTMYAKSTGRYMETFFYSLLPRMDIKDEYIVKLTSLKLKTPDSHSKFINLMNEGIEILLRTKEIRALAET